MVQKGNLFRGITLAAVSLGFCMLPIGNTSYVYKPHKDTTYKTLHDRRISTVEMFTYWWPLLCQPGGTVKCVAGLQDSRFGRVKTLPLLCGSDGPLHVLLHTRYQATLDAPAARGGTGRPGAALPSDIMKGDIIKWLTVISRCQDLYCVPLCVTR